jgi:hypothetical protein
MFLGTPRRWWVAAAIPLVLSLVLLATGDGTVLRTVVAIVLLLLAILLFGMAPMRYGQGARTPPERTTDTSPTVPVTSSDRLRSRPALEGRDASEV